MALKESPSRMSRSPEVIKKNNSGFDIKRIAARTSAGVSIILIGAVFGSMSMSEVISQNESFSVGLKVIGLTTAAIGSIMAGIGLNAYGRVAAEKTSLNNRSQVGRFSHRQQSPRRVSMVDAVEARLHEFEEKQKRIAA